MASLPRLSILFTLVLCVVWAKPDANPDAAADAAADPDAFADAEADPAACCRRVSVMDSVLLILMSVIRYS